MSGWINEANLTAGNSNQANGLRESEYNRRTGGGKTARPGPCGGRRVTGVPSVPGMGQDLQPETRLPERVTTTVEKRKGEAARPA